MANELKPCPFCGNAPTLSHMGSGSYTVSCSNGHHINTEASKEKAVTAWNTRPSSYSDELEAIVKQAMQDEWEEICADTGCHPLDIEHGRGKRLSFIPLHWASAVAGSVRSQAEAIIAAKDTEIKQLKADLQTHIDGTTALVDEKIDAEFKAVDLAKDNAALTARVKELDQSRAEILNQQDKGWRELQNRAETLETQLAAALGGKSNG